MENRLLGLILVQLDIVYLWIGTSIPFLLNVNIDIVQFKLVFVFILVILYYFLLLSYPFMTIYYFYLCCVLSLLSQLTLFISPPVVLEFNCTYYSLPRLCFQMIWYDLLHCENLGILCFPFVSSSLYVAAVYLILWYFTCFIFI